jgi:hypothetical protein
MKCLNKDIRSNEGFLFHGCGSGSGIRIPEADLGDRKWQKIFGHFYNFKVQTRIVQIRSIYDEIFILNTWNKNLSSIVLLWIRIRIRSGLNDFMDPDRIERKSGSGSVLNQSGSTTLHFSILNNSIFHIRALKG